MTSPAGPPRGASSFWVDESLPDRAWMPPPVDTPVPGDSPRRRRRLLTVGAPVLAVILIIGLVWALGGFTERGDKITDVGVGQVFRSGPYEFRFTDATVQRQKQYDDKVINKLIAKGTIRNTWTEATSPDDDWFLIGDPADGTTVQADLGEIARSPDAPSDGPTMITPGLPAVPYEVQFTLSSSTRFRPTIDFAVPDLSYGNHTVFSSSKEETWGTHNGELYRMQLPLKVLPPEKDY